MRLAHLYLCLSSTTINWMCVFFWSTHFSFDRFFFFQNDYFMYICVMYSCELCKQWLIFQKVTKRNETSTTRWSLIIMWYTHTTRTLDHCSWRHFKHTKLCFILFYFMHMLNMLPLRSLAPAAAAATISTTTSSDSGNNSTNRSSSTLRHSDNSTAALLAPHSIVDCSPQNSIHITHMCSNFPR